MPRLRWILTFLSVLVLFTCTSGRPFQQRTPEAGIYFPETGFYVNGEFLKIYLTADNPPLIFGLPISGVLKHPLRPEVQVQYFQRARIEYDPNAPEGKRTSLAPLGNWLYDATKRGSDSNIDTSSAACRFFESTRHFVCFAFLQFYNAHNGAVFFGDPISEVETVGERKVQYFQQARMEWWPEHASGMRVSLTDVGALDLGKFGGSQPPEYVIQRPEKLLVRVFPSKPLLGPNENQTIFVIVQDQLYNPVPGALVTMTVSQPDGTSSPYRLAETNANGISKQENIPVGLGKPNQMVIVNVTVNLPDVEMVETTTWYRIWW